VNATHPQYVISELIPKNRTVYRVTKYKEANMFKKIYNTLKMHINLATVTVACLIIGFMFLFTLPNPANAVMFIFWMCVVLYYIVWKVYTARVK